MKRILALTLVLTSVTCLFATVYRSNQLGQMLSVADSRLNEGYFLEMEGDVSSLYCDGVLVSRTTRSNDELGLVVIEEDLAKEVTTIRQYKDGLLLRETVTDKDSSVSTSYGYMEGHLAFCSTFKDGEEEPSSVTFFLRSSDDGSLVAIRDNEGLRFLSESYIYQTGELYQMAAKDLMLKGDYEILEDGSIQYEEAGTVYLYSPEGLLLETKGEKSSTRYTYENYELLSTETLNDAERIVETYVDGKVSETSVYRGEELSSVTRHLEGGNVQILYKDGRKVATVYYNEDNRTVKRIEYN